MSHNSLSKGEGLHISYSASYQRFTVFEMAADSLARGTASIALKWTRGAASNHTAPPNSHTNPSLHELLLIFRPAEVGGCVGLLFSVIDFYLFVDCHFWFLKRILADADLRRKFCFKHSH